MGLHAERYRIKIREVVDITIVMRVLKKAKHQILKNITNEISFKPDLSFLEKKEEVDVGELMKEQMASMKDMFSTITGEIADIKNSVRSL
jgi:hypothetical protein